ncbi:hypothetical protein D3C84_573350 [compost metagenome]
MNGLALSASDSTQLVVARYNKALRSGPGSQSAQPRVERPASDSSVMIPAAAMARRCLDLRSFQLSPVSV